MSRPMHRGRAHLAWFVLSISCTSRAPLPPLDGARTDDAAEDRAAADDAAPADAQTPRDANGPRDGATELDGGAPDAMTPDVAPTDVVVPTDVVAPTDVVVPTDVVAPTDVVVTADVVVPTDVVAPTDVVTPTDIVVPTDVVAPMDVVTPRDVVTPLDTVTPVDVVVRPDVGVTDVVSPDAGPSPTCGLTSRLEFPLPPGFSMGALNTFSDTSLTCPAGGGNGDPSFALLDLDGDQLVDLVMPDSCTDTLVGTSRWAMYRNTGAAFAATATAWTLPAGYGTGSFTSFSDTSLTCPTGGAGGDPSYALIDMDGDARPDLVMPDSCTDSSTGTSHWVLHRNTGTGFATATSWSLPAGYGTGAFNAFSDTSLTCPTGGGGGDPSYALIDMDGDARPDLVMPDSCTDTAVGTSRWVVHRNTGTGFATATMWTLPTSYGTGSFTSLSDTSLTCPTGGAGGDPSYALIDMDGDARPDLVMPDSCTDSTVGTSHWVLHRNTGTGFAAATSWPLPAGFTTGAFTAFSDTSLTCPTGGANGDPSYALIDMDGDARPDLVMPDSCTDTRVGSTAWVMYRNTGAGFSATSTLLALPAGFTAGAFTTFSDTSLTCPTGGGEGDPSFALVPLTGDRRPQLVMPDSCTDPQVGTSRWIVYASTCPRAPL